MSRVSKTCKKVVSAYNFLETCMQEAVFKNGDSKNQGNYRPISILPEFSKVHERIIYNGILNHCTINNLLFLKKLGFRAKHSTHHAILNLVNDIAKSFEKCECILGIFVDLPKAFDAVNHDILLTKHHNYGIKGNYFKLLESYLVNRKQYICF